MTSHCLKCGPLFPNKVGRIVQPVRDGEGWKKERTGSFNVSLALEKEYLTCFFEVKKLFLCHFLVQQDLSWSFDKNLQLLSDIEAPLFELGICKQDP